jgi:tRNA threonylcarbamoyladenosine biosynthesis protein TsaB
MKLLALDTACSACSVAVRADGAIIASRAVAMRQDHAEALVPMVIDVMGEASVSFGDLDVVAVTLGPGSFTGLRTGMAAAKGFALAYDLPIVGVTSLEAVALAAWQAAPRELPFPSLTVALETRRQSVFLQSFDPDRTPLNEPVAVTLEEAVEALPKNGTVLAGDAASRIVLAMDEGIKKKNVLLIDSVTGPDARYVAEIAAGRWVEGGTGDVAGKPGRSVAPLYVQPPEAKRPVAGGRLRS